ncbi:hypothetical protein NQ317_006849 [Molorchus minor]|uniref:Uncharacterized protein n=1 Tax=Molorchus minor TaxID=1323400 RepID=A0ABQ9K1Y0_9CUCU|nr:hypothetical protein NQ317_006849 [Molorchus minor]
MGAASATVNNINSTAPHTSQQFIIAEGGDIPNLPQRKENVSAQTNQSIMLSKVDTKLLGNGNKNSSTDHIVLTQVKENFTRSSETNDAQAKVDPKSAINLNNTTANKNNSVLIKKTTQTTKQHPTKPCFTEEDDDPIKTELKPVYVPNIPSIDTLEKKSERSTYVIPIVAVIFSVPLVAIIISVVYKRGADWWQHRNYRRMDFLIEGMYNN